ncbi:MAG: DNA polymerase III subunit alpha, partial [Pelolinea sp.]|nr:DNA polymerase III subunit alpha [Pelolinea sp.]
MPDIDLDFQDDKRAEIMQYCAQKYGEDHVASIITFGTMGARAAIRDVGRVMDIPLSEVDKVAKLIPNIPSRPISIPDALNQVADLKKLYESSETLRNLIDSAANMEGVVRNAGTHAAGVVISDKPIVEYVPLHRPTNKSEDIPIKIVTQFEMSIVDHLGLLKVDFLGLSTLTVMHQASVLIENRHGIKYDLGNIPIDDPETFVFLGKGFTAGVFQLEGAQMTKFLMQMKPDKLDHIIAMVALYRPGPMAVIPSYIARMQGREEITYKHPMLEPILRETYGFAIYQEQIMRAAMQLAGYTAAEADMLRKVISKKKIKELEKHHVKFVEGAVKNGIEKKIADEIFTEWDEFAHYGFNKSHAADYGVIAIQTAFLKAHYPIEYMTAQLSQSKNDSDKVAAYVSDSRAMGITIESPDVNFSGWDFEIEDHEDSPSVIRFGLGAIKNVGFNSVEIIVEARKEGLFKDINDFARRVDLRKVGRRPLECMIRVGALDSIGDKCAFLDKIEQIVAVSESHFRAREVGQLTIFGGVEGLQEEIVLQSTLSIEIKEQLEWEKELLGLYLSDHPLSAYLPFIKGCVTHTINQLIEAENDSCVIVCGSIEDIRTVITKKGAEMAFVRMADIQSEIELVFFPKTWDKLRGKITLNNVLLVKGRIDTERRDPNILVDSVEGIDLEKFLAAQEHLTAFTSAHFDKDEDDPGINDSTHKNEVDRLEDKDHIPLFSSEEITPQNDFGIQNKNGPEPAHKEIEDMGKEYQPMIENRSVNSCKIVEVILNSTGSKQKDNRNLRRVYGVLTSTPGNDHFTFLCKENGNTFRFDFPNDSTEVNDSLIRELYGIVGEVNVRISA